MSPKAPDQDRHLKIKVSGLRNEEDERIKRRDELKRFFDFFPNFVRDLYPDIVLA